MDPRILNGVRGIRTQMSAAPANHQRSLPQPPPRPVAQLPRAAPAPADGDLRQQVAALRRAYADLQMVVSRLSEKTEVLTQRLALATGEAQPRATGLAGEGPSSSEPEPTPEAPPADPFYGDAFDDPEVQRFVAFTGKK